MEDFPVIANDALEVEVVADCLVNFVLGDAARLGGESSHDTAYAELDPIDGSLVLPRGAPSGVFSGEDDVDSLPILFRLGLLRLADGSDGLSDRDEYIFCMSENV